MHWSLSNGRPGPASKITLLASLSAQRLLSLQLENGQKIELNQSGNRSGLPFWVVVIPFSLKMVHILDGAEFPWTGQMRRDEASRTWNFLISLWPQYLICWCSNNHKWNKTSWHWTEKGAVTSQPVSKVQFHSSHLCGERSKVFWLRKCGVWHPEGRCPNEILGYVASNLNILIRILTVRL